MGQKKTLLLILFFFLFFTFFINAKIYLLKINGPIDSVTEEYISDSYEIIKHDDKSELIIIGIDTPGGFSTSMRSIIKEIMNSKIPTVVYVSPKGARAASAGFLITIAANIAAMAPGTNMGAAHPVSAMGKKIGKIMNEKVTNDAVSYVKSLAKTRNRNTLFAALAVEKSRSYTAKECLENNLIDIIATDINDLIDKISGKEYLLNRGGKAGLIIKDRHVIKLEMSWRQKFLKTITNPNLAYFLIIIGLAGLYIEFTHPGLIIPGVVGGISLLLAFLAFQVLPINYIGLLLILLSTGLFIAEIKIQGFGILGIGGIIAFALGSVMLINSPIPEMRPAMLTIVTVTIFFALLFLGLAYKVVKVMKKRAETGAEGIIGEEGKSLSSINSNHGKVFVHGEIWKAISETPIKVNEKIEVISINNLTLKVIRKED